MYFIFSAYYILLVYNYYFVSKNSCKDTMFFQTQVDSTKNHNFISHKVKCCIFAKNKIQKYGACN